MSIHENLRDMLDEREAASQVTTDAVKTALITYGALVALDKLSRPVSYVETPREPAPASGGTNVLGVVLAVAGGTFCLMMVALFVAVVFGP